MTYLPEKDSFLLMNYRELRLRFLIMNTFTKILKIAVDRDILNIDFL